MEAAFIIAFREGMEAFLIVGIILVLLKKLSLKAIQNYVWGGVLLGLVVSIVLGFVLSVVIDGFESEDLQYNISLFALAVAIILLTYMILWMQKGLSKKGLETKITQSNNHKILIFVLIFSAIFREGLETVLFSFTLAMNGTASKDIYIGLASGFVLSGMLIAILFKSTIGVPIKQFFTYSRYLIVLIVSGLVALFIKGLQAYEYLPTFRAPLFDSTFLIANDSTLGKFLGVLIGYDATPSLLQFSSQIAYTVLILTFLSFQNRRN